MFELTRRSFMKSLGVSGGLVSIPPLVGAAGPSGGLLSGLRRLDGSVGSGGPLDDES
jgi:hypothetical protein